MQNMDSRDLLNLARERAREFRSELRRLAAAKTQNNAAVKTPKEDCEGT